jgi:hypothetical protein
MSLATVQLLVIDLGNGVGTVGIVRDRNELPENFSGIVAQFQRLPYVDQLGTRGGINNHSGHISCLAFGADRPFPY